MRPLFNLFLLVFFTSIATGQDDGDYNEMLLNAETILYAQPDESIKIANHVLQNSINTQQLFKAYLLNTTAFYIKGSFEDAVNAAIEAKIIAEETSNSVRQLRATMAAVPLLYHLGLDVVAQQYYKNTLEATPSNISQNEKSYFKASDKLVNAFKELGKDNWQKAYSNFEEAKSVFKDFPDQILLNEATTWMTTIHPKLSSTETAESHLTTLLFHTKNDSQNRYLEMVVLNKLGELYFLKQEYLQAVQYYQQALQIAEIFKNSTYLSHILENLSAVHLALKNSQEFYSYKKRAQEFNDEAETSEELAVNAIYNYINENNISKKEALKGKFTLNMLILSAIFVVIILTWLLLRFWYRNRTKQYNRFLTYIENREKQAVGLPIKEVSKGLNIPKETETILVKRLAQFEKSKHFTKRDMSLAALAAQLDTNTKYLSEVINSHKGKNFNAYINELRINYIIDKLKSNRTYLQYKISYLAEESGFSSHSSFATVFKSVTGISPTVFIDLLKSRNKTSNSVYENVE
ncbi:MAG: hypothetical protein CL526_01005 [Aequorivita sp.]|nr:hypothetical protein [Aequorivita sp.]|tara:strand:- start:81542 stop:83101 length:1560 start_codon:yes stop_codon:yes gene_type:complete